MASISPTSMLKEQDTGNVGMLERHFDDIRARLLLDSIIAGNTRARMWADQDNALLWDRANNVIYADCDRPTNNRVDEMRALIRRTIGGASLKRGRPYFKLVLMGGSPPSIGRPLMGRLIVGKTKTRRYVHDSALPKSVSTCPPGIRLEPISRRLLGRPHIWYRKYVLWEIRQMWPSLDKFHERGFGFAVHDNKKILSWCTSEYVSGASCGIGIETIEGHQKKGYASAVALKFVEHCKKECIVPHWECSARNEPSNRLARKVGFAQMAEYPAFVGRFR